MSFRRITNRGGRKNIGKFPSRKACRPVWWESGLERDFLYLLELDSDVLSYSEQEVRIMYKLDGKRRHYTPDFMVIRVDKRQIVEVKPEHKASSDEYKRLFRIAKNICSRQGYDFVVVTEKIIRLQPRLDNVRLLYRYSGVSVTSEALSACREIGLRDSALTLKSLEEQLLARGIAKPERLRQIVFALICKGVVSIDLMKPLGDGSVVKLPTPEISK